MNITLTKGLVLELRSDLFWYRVNEELYELYLFGRNGVQYLGKVYSELGFADPDNGRWHAVSTRRTDLGMPPSVVLEHFASRRTAEHVLLDHVKISIDWPRWLRQDAMLLGYRFRYPEPVILDELIEARRTNYQGDVKLILHGHSSIPIVWDRALVSELSELSELSVSVGSVCFVDEVKDWFVLAENSSWVRVSDCGEPEKAKKSKKSKKPKQSKKSKKLEEEAARRASRLQRADRRICRRGGSP